MLHLVFKTFHHLSPSMYFFTSQKYPNASGICFQRSSLYFWSPLLPSLTSIVLLCPWYQCHLWQPHYIQVQEHFSLTFRNTWISKDLAFPTKPNVFLHIYLCYSLSTTKSFKSFPVSITGNITTFTSISMLLLKQESTDPYSRAKMTTYTLFFIFKTTTHPWQNFRLQLYLLEEPLVWKSTHKHFSTAHPINFTTASIVSLPTPSQNSTKPHMP